MDFLKKINRLKRDIEFWWFYKNFYKNFFFYTTKDPEELKGLYKIRFEVYCEEYGYIDKNKTENGLEHDEWDEHSEHFIIRDINKEIAASVRLILDSPSGFPIEKHFQLDIDLNINYNRKEIAEISRLIVISKYRKKHLMFVLLKGIYLFVKTKNIKNVFSVMDDKLYPLLIKLGIPFKKIGKPSLYQGYTYPCVLNVKELEEELQQNNKKFYNYLTDGIIKFDDSQHKYTLS
ncbi:MAG: GNAT family N-acetyltransferase [Patescibacteria group bacterium]|jgi:N-acyl-L-homoserine lactone synthetase